MVTQNIVVVEDDPDLLEVLRETLAREGYLVHTADNGLDGLRLIKKLSPDLVCLDLMMPGMDGIEVLGKLKSAGCRADVVMMTGYGNVPTAVEAMKMGASDCIEKPFKPDDLGSMIEDILLRRHRTIDLFDDPVVAYIQQHATEISSRKDVAVRLG